MSQDTGKFRKNSKDQFYTKATIAKVCTDAILARYPDANSYHWIEPSAGNGVFLKCLPETYKKIGIDIDPKAEGILKANFLEWTPTSEKPCIFFGNPPFGRQSSLAKSFIKHAAQYGSILAFILPRSFVKPSMTRAFPKRFHCVYNVELEKNAFEVNNQPYDVPCVFQIWEKKDTERPMDAAIKEQGFTYVKHGESFHIAFKRVGGLAGKCYPTTVTAKTDYNPNYHYFLRLQDVYAPHVQKIIDGVNSHVFPSNTVGPRSLSKSEANEVLNEVLQTALSS